MSHYSLGDGLPGSFGSSVLRCLSASCDHRRDIYFVTYALVHHLIGDLSSFLLRVLLGGDAVGGLQRLWRSQNGGERTALTGADVGGLVAYIFSCDILGEGRASGNSPFVISSIVTIEQ